MIFFLEENMVDTLLQAIERIRAKIERYEHDIICLDEHRDYMEVRRRHLFIFVAESVLRGLERLRDAR
jgi:hypothetical protein